MPFVLVVDDEDVLLEMIAALIEDMGLRAVTATNGQEALELLQSSPDPPVLIISDVMMPQVNGVALARAVKQDRRLKNVPIVLMSAAGRSPQNGLATHFLHKPFDIDRLEELIAQYVRG